ncbi:MAG: recombination protein RecR [Bacteroidetes bacterium GWF2_43_63]|nr:MAG: recombination protein RecR [Bacteroidetes bacterium GWE2_42_42]OFY52615.1 MAG: recombination protein RecR [Bacteroidetes bacterium GWF2_43_63]HBG69888.1 recombination protein RecR [Bacteroidales bacterium]HCB62685.1 recombination protein RecR [Bacteroidales bacterium]HCY23553.1 recombination protein RecR [Bacteroidales bacterium]
MFFEQLPSKYLENAVSELSKLPGVGRKTALRLALHLLRQDKSLSTALGNSLIELREKITYCSVCHNISDSETCPVCANPSRDRSVICVVEDIRDVMAVERTSQFNGVYHVLGGLISPIDGIRPQDIFLDSLQQRVEENPINEIILALSATVEGDTTAFYIFRQLKHLNISFSTISRGISIGDELEYIDEVTLGRSIQARVPYQQLLVSEKS